jgi:uncharacterized protein YodC (DUF2158 family)
MVTVQSFQVIGDMLYKHTGGKMAEIKVGAVVQLKAGGPKMTVSLVSKAMGGTTPQAWCDWFEGMKKMDGNFPLT